MKPKRLLLCVLALLMILPALAMAEGDDVTVPEIQEYVCEIPDN